MRRAVACYLALSFLSFGLLAADKESQAAATTRKKLQIKVTVDYKEETFSEIIKDLKKKVDEGGGGSLSTTNDAGVSNNTKYSYDGKDQTVADVLDGLLKKNSLGYIVVSKPGDRYDGWIKFKQGNERGSEAGAEPKAGKPAVKEKEKEKPKDTPPAENDDEKAEKTAQNKLDFAKDLLKDGKKDKAKTRLEDIIKDYPKTKAAEEAKKELDKLIG